MRDGTIRLPRNWANWLDKPTSYPWGLHWYKSPSSTDYVKHLLIIVRTTEKLEQGDGLGPVGLEYDAVYVGRMIGEYFHDFCGGFIWRSPYVSRHVYFRLDDDWNVPAPRLDGYLAGKGAGWRQSEKSQLTDTSKSLIADFSVICPLDFTKCTMAQKRNFMTRWMVSALTRSALAWNLGANRAMVHANGRSHVSRLSALGNSGPLTNTCGVQMAHVVEEAKRLSNSPIVLNTLGHAFTPSIVAHSTPEFRNHNSSNTCRGWNILLKTGRSTDMSAAQKTEYNGPEVDPLHTDPHQSSFPRTEEMYKLTRNDCTLTWKVG